MVTSHESALDHGLFEGECVRIVRSLFTKHGVATQDGASLRLIDGQHHLGFYQDGVWVDLGRAVLRMTDCEEGTGAYKMMWTLAEPEEWGGA